MYAKLYFKYIDLIRRISCRDAVEERLIVSATVVNSIPVDEYFFFSYLREKSQNYWLKNENIKTFKIYTKIKIN